MRTKDAHLVTDAADVLDIVGELGVDDSPLRRGAEPPHDDLDELHLRVLEGLPVAARRSGHASVARVAGVTSALACCGCLGLLVGARAGRDGRRRVAQGAGRRCRPA